MRLLRCLGKSCLIQLYVLAGGEFFLWEQVKESLPLPLYFLIVGNIFGADAVLDHLADSCEANNLVYIWLNDLFLAFALFLLNCIAAFQLLILLLLILVHHPGVIDETLEPFIHVVAAHILQIKQIHLDNLFQSFTVSIN